ncbi:MAG: methyltransferase domain-containing protein [Solirubrobacteraceae bacterium]
MDDLIEESVGLRGAALQVLRPRDTEALLDEHAFEHEEYLPYWAELWPSGVALARRVAARSLRGARVLELGCGLGLPSLAAALAGGRVLATDWSPQAIALLEDNAERNEAVLETAIVDWAHPAAIVERAPWDLVLAADVLYERRNVAPLLDLLPRLGREVWIADPGRAAAGALLDGLAEGWTREDEADGRVTVHRLMRTDGPSAAE